MQIPDEMLKEIRESGYDQELVFTQIRKLLESDKPIKENEYNLELIDNYLLDKDPQELSKNAGFPQPFFNNSAYSFLAFFYFFVSISI